MDESPEIRGERFLTIRRTAESRFRRVLPALAALLLSGSAAAQPAPPVTTQPFATGLSFPLGLAHAGDGSGRVFLLQQTGQILVHTGSQLLATPFLDVRPLLPEACRAVPPRCGESGLLGLAFHPDYESNGYFYVNYTNSAGNQAIVRYHVSSNPNLGDPASATPILTIGMPAVFHHGGDLRFGADGYLYVSVGEAGSGEAPSLSSLRGKLLRLDVDGGAPYAIPPTNPFVGVGGALPEIWAYGLRNPWRFSFDRLTRDLWIGDPAGLTKHEEVDFQPAASGGGENYGFPRMEGFACLDPPTDCNDGTLTLPILDYDHSLGSCAVTGGFVYRGSLYPQLYGVYLFGDYCGGPIWGVTRDNAGIWSRTPVASTGFFLSSFGEDEAGNVYAVDHSGGVHRIVASTSYAIPAVTSLFPAAAIAGDPALTLTVNGAGFHPASVVRWNGAPRTTFYVSRTRLTATIPASDLAATGGAAVTVVNPTPGGGISSPKGFDVNRRFLDVPAAYWAEGAVEAIAAAGITSGCGNRRFCPEAPVTRAQLAPLVLKAARGASFSPPPATGAVFADVSTGSFAAAWIEALSAEGITSGCGMGNFCPGAVVTRAPLAVVLLKALEGGSYRPEAATGLFADVPAGGAFAPWIEDLARRAITSGCGGGNYCPDGPVSRAQLAVFLVRAFSIPLSPAGRSPGGR
jgi:glucose/arabinose dehydrogenase